jgi:hypothetical protein
MSIHKQLLRDVFYCTRCNPAYGFSRPDYDKPYFKFPPTIGALNKADLLFVGINPRISKNNKYLHEKIITNKRAFADLAENRGGDKIYISKHSEEKHYHHHVEIVEALFGQGAKFEDHAAVTELYFCATPNATALPTNHYPCADLFFDRVFLKVQPRFVICVWKKVFDYFRRRFHITTYESFIITIKGHSSIVIFLPHPNSSRR